MVIEEREPSREDITLTGIELAIANLIYTWVPLGATCPNCGEEISPEECITAPTNAGISTGGMWKRLAQRIIKEVKEHGDT